jgi:hypothetical protein
LAHGKRRLVEEEDPRLEVEPKTEEVTAPWLGLGWDKVMLLLIVAVLFALKERWLFP